MTKLTVHLDPNLLAHPVPNLPQALADFFIQGSGGALTSPSWEHARDGKLEMTLETKKPAAAVPTIVKAIETRQLQGNDLREAILVTLDSEEGPDAVYP